MDQEAFYKDQYDKSLAEKTEINSSLSTPIGILTALLAGLYYCATNFNYDDNDWLSLTFIAIALLSAVLLVIAIVYLILAFSDFGKNRRYYNLNDAAVLNKYYLDLVSFYVNNPPTAPSTPENQAKKDFNDYLLAEIIRNAANNQKTNRVKTALLFQSHKFMIYALISLSLLILPFGIDFGVGREIDKVQKVKIDQVIPINLNIKYQRDTTERLLIKPKDDGQSTKQHNKTDTATIADHTRG